MLIGNAASHYQISIGIPPVLPKLAVLALLFYVLLNRIYDVISHIAEFLL